MTNYKHLFEPIKIGKKTVRNRIFMPPISTNLANKGYITDELVQHYSARAKGGVGLIVSEVVTVEPTYVYLPGDISIHDDSYIEGWKKFLMKYINMIRYYYHNCSTLHIWHSHYQVLHN